MTTLFADRDDFLSFFPLPNRGGVVCVRLRHVVRGAKPGQFPRRDAGGLFRNVFEDRFLSANAKRSGEFRCRPKDQLRLRCAVRTALGGGWPSLGRSSFPLGGLIGK